MGFADWRVQEGTRRVGDLAGPLSSASLMGGAGCGVLP